MANEWSIDTDDWAIADESVYIENPEYIQVTTDNDDKILEGIKENGAKVIGGDLEVNGKTSVRDVTVIGNLDLVNESIQSVDSSEYLKVNIDAQNKVLNAIKKDGSHYIHNVQSESIDALKESINEVELYSRKLNTFKKVSILGDSISTFDQEGFKIDGYPMWYPTNPEDRGADVISVEDTWWKQVINNIGGIIEVNASYSGSTASTYNTGFSSRVPLLGNPDVIYIALGTNDDAVSVPIGDIDFDTEYYDLSYFAPAYIKGMKDTIAAYPKAEIICVAFDMREQYQDVIKVIADHFGAKYYYVGDITDVHPNKAEMKAAANVIGDVLPMYIEKNQEGSLEVKTDKDDKILSYRQSDGTLVEKVGINSPLFNGQSISDIQKLDSRLPIVNVTSRFLMVNNNDIIGLELTKNEVECTVEFVSNEKRFIENDCTIAYQGNSTLNDEKKGFSIIFPTKHMFKDWIAMDEFRLKGYGKDWTSGKDIVANRLYGQILATRSFETGKPWRKYNDFAADSIRLLMDADKKCHMDGFPVELYINGSYWGLYVFEIRKERDNYNLDKKDKKHIQIEGEGMHADSSFTWNTVEIRNPKGYDEYVEPEDGPVKDFIVNWFNGISMITNNTSPAELEEYLDCQNFIDWYLHNAIIGNEDVVSKNTEYTTWDRKHMTLIPQDLNGTFGSGSEYNADELATVAYNYCSWIQTALHILSTQINARYAELRKNGVFTESNIVKLWNDWCAEIGTDVYEEDQKRWNRNRTPLSNIFTWIKNRITYLDTRFNYINV